MNGDEPIKRWDYGYDGIVEEPGVGRFFEASDVEKAIADVEDVLRPIAARAPGVPGERADASLKTLANLRTRLGFARP